MKYYGIKTPEPPKDDDGLHHPDSFIWWLADSEHGSWMAFFQYPSNKKELMAHRLPLAEAIEAYSAIGYRCVELEVKELYCRDH